MADSQVEQQVTSQTPATKRVAAGKVLARKTKEAREAQKKALIEAQSIIAAAKDGPPPVTPSADTPAADPPPGTPSANLTTTQWLSVISIIVSLAGIYYKREEIKSVFTKKSPVEFQPPRAPPVDAKRKVGIMEMD